MISIAYYSNQTLHYGNTISESGENEWTSGLLFVGYNSNLLIIAVCNMLTDLMS